MRLDNFELIRNFTNMRKILWMVGLFLNSFAFSQVSEGFNDGELLHQPVWMGDTGRFFINQFNQLQCKAYLKADTAYLSTQNKFLLNTSWEFYLQLNMDPSSSNYVRVFLAYDKPSLDSPGNGYFLHIGESGSTDSYDLFRKSYNSITKIIDAPAKTRQVVDTLKSWFLINHSTDGLWEIFSRSDTNSNWIFEGSSNDKTFYSCTYTGVSVKHTPTRSDKVIFDDLKITPLELDTLAPLCLNINFINDSTVQVQFTEDIDTIKLVQEANFLLDEKYIPKSVIAFQQKLDVIQLIFEKKIEAGEHELVIRKVSDLHGNTTRTHQLVNGNFSPQLETQVYEVFISEIMADPSPAVDLPETEYIELYNSSNTSFELAGWEYQVGTTKVKLPNYTLNANQLVILCKNSDTSYFKSYGNVIGLSTWPSLLNNGVSLKLINSKGKNIDEVNYTIEWYKNKSKSTGGYSLEYQSNKKICDDFYLWGASESGTGGTPGRINSKWNERIEDLYVQQIQIINDSSIYIKFNIPPDTSSLFNRKNYNILNSVIIPQKIKFANNNFNEIILEYSSKFNSKTKYDFQIDHIYTCSNEVLLENNFSIWFANSDDTSKIRINELYVDPYPSNGLAEAEYIELYNASSNTIQLNGYSITIGSTKYYLPAYSFKPSEYILICSSNDTTEIKNYGKCIGIPGLISLSNTSASILISNKVGRTIDRVVYKNTWYRDFTKFDGGWSLELIDPYNRCDFINKWGSSIHSKGGTPGKRNSIADFNIDQRNLGIASFQNINGMEFKIKMNKSIDGRYINPAQLYFVNSKSKLFFPQKMEIDSPYYQVFTLKFSNPLPLGKYNLVCQYIPSCSREDTNIVLPVNIASVTNFIENIYISEVMADPSPSIGLPEVEYIELYNNNNESIENITFHIADTKDTIAITLEHWKAKSYLVLCNKENRNAWDSSVAIVPLNKLISLGNESDSISLLDKYKIKFDEFNYSYLQLPKEKRDGGYSYCRMKETWDCRSDFVWQASNSKTGGSPGKENEGFEEYNLPSLEIQSYEFLAEDKVKCKIYPKVEHSAYINISDEKNITSFSTITPDGSLIIGFREKIKAGTLAPLGIYLSNCLRMELDTSIEFYNKHIPKYKEILINEILFNPNPGGVDYIELYNNSDSIINIQDLKISDDKNTYTINEILNTKNENSLIKPKEYRVLSINSEAVLSQYFVKQKEHLIETTKMISMPDDKGLVKILNDKNEIIDEFEYSEDYHLRWLKEKEGRSLERKRFNYESNTTENWSSATDDNGLGTPTYKNSQSIDNMIISSTTFWLSKEVLNPIRNQTDKQIEINYDLGDETKLVNVKVFTSSGQYIGEIITHSSVRNSGIFVWDMSTNGILLPTGTYILNIETYTEKGVNQYYKIPFVLHY